MTTPRPFTLHVTRHPSPAGLPQLWPSTGEYPIYDGFLYHAMTTDTARNRMFEQALASCAAGRHVVDIGAGKDLNWARFALAAGARQATAIEELPQSYEAALTGLRRRPPPGPIEVICQSAADVHLDPRAEVAVSETIGCIAGAEGLATIAAQARANLLGRDGVFVPHQVQTVAALAHLPSLLGTSDPAFSEVGAYYVDKIFEWNRAPFDVRLAVLDPDLAGVRSTGAVVEQLSLNSPESTAQPAPADVRVERAGPMDGVVLWLRAQAGDGGPVLDALETPSNWGPIYVPLFAEPILVKAGDQARITMTSRLSDDGLHPDYEVSLTLPRPGGTTTQASRLSQHHGGSFREGRLYQHLFMPA